MKESSDRTESADSPESTESRDWRTDLAPTVRPLGPEEMGQVETLLAAYDLPYRDIRTEPVQFRGAEVDGELVGVGGLERYDAAGLLRSVAVQESFRGQGLGTRLCDELEARARETGVETLYLLTTTAADFFRARGYDEVDRSAAPASIQETTEFQDLCPSSAVCLHKRASIGLASIAASERRDPPSTD